jgi:BioD-like phosphotransacetylase family protein
VAATSQNDGKTSCALGFLKAFEGLAKSVGFIKPVGQRYLTINGQQVDEDTVLVQKVFGLQCPLKDMSPVAIERDFTRRYLDAPDQMLPRLEAAIRTSFAVAANNNDLVIIEGTGHAGVGSVFDLSNARVAKMLNAKVVIVTRGGIGRPIDEIALNRSLFEREGVEVAGVIVNQVASEKLEQTRKYVERALGRMGLRLLGVIPFVQRLMWPTVGQVAEEIGAEILNGRQCLTNEIAEILVGAMTAHNAITYFVDRALLIVPADRDDVVLAAMSTDMLRSDIEVAGIVLTGALQLAPQVMELIRNTHIPVLTVQRPTYETASAIHDITVKIQETDAEKIQTVTALVQEHVDLRTLWEAIA